MIHIYRYHRYGYLRQSNFPALPEPPCEPLNHFQLEAFRAKTRRLDRILPAPGFERDQSFKVGVADSGVALATYLNT